MERPGPIGHFLLFRPAGLPPVKCQGAEPLMSRELNAEFLSSARVFAWSVREILERAVLQEIAGSKLTFPQLKLLYLVAHTDELTTIGDVAAFLGVSNASASKSVDKLVKRRLLRRAEIAADRRSSSLSLTEAGRRLLHSYEAARDRKAAETFDQFPADQLRIVAEVLDHLAGVMVAVKSGEPHVCLQCEIYYRENCRFGELGRRNCFYQRRKTEKRENGSQAGEASRE